MSLEASIRLSAEELCVGESMTVKCPVCERHKMSVTRNADALLYNCYRATCAARGFISVTGVYTRNERKLPELKPYFGEKHKAEDRDIDYFYNRFGISEATCLEHIWTNERDEYVLPIYDTYGLGRGNVVRQPAWKGDPTPVRHGGLNRPKARTWMHAAGPAQSWYGLPGEVVVLVEDQISAICVAQAGITSVALLGTQLNTEKVREIASMRPELVIIALDDDATSVAFELGMKWNLAFNKLRVNVLERDLKEEDPQDIAEILLL